MNQISLTEKEKNELRNMDLVLCPDTYKELHGYVKTEESKLKLKLDEMREEENKRRNISLNGSKLKNIKIDQKSSLHPLSKDT